MKVAKFGGSSVASAEQIRKVGRIVADDPDRRIVVVSAPGKRFPGDTKVTDMLIGMAQARLSGESGEPQLTALIERYASIARDLELPEATLEPISADLRQRMKSDHSNTDQYLDNLKAAGEDNCARLFAQALRSVFNLDAHYVSPRDAGLLMSSEFGNAQVLPESYLNLESLASRPGVTVFPGFFGYTREGQVATFPRGGSDITGSILAAAVKADLYENFTDVDSVYAADPRIVEKPNPIDILTYHEMRELSYAGFGVFHDEAIIPAVQANIPICVKNTNRPEAPGTMIVPHREHKAGTVTGVASNEGFCSIFVEKFLMNRQVGFGRRLLQILEEENLSFQHMPTGIDNISVIFREQGFTAEMETRIIARIRETLDPDQLSVEHGLALVMIVGEGMNHSVGIAGRATTALARAGVNIEMINQGSSELSMMFGVKAQDRAKAVRALYEELGR
ncbi:MAG TPA: aspartate kinase [Candidatus Sumerlaeota bacterium]|nr:aspartate kinase [Candidatus Sumerlaeota bacterium]HPS01139.1 aspartate kinase [Candidatus Sumerlaeota bacterium]